MARRQEANAELNLKIPDQALAQSLIRRWSGYPDVSVHILRARISRFEARFNLELQGSAARVARILHESSIWNLPPTENRHLTGTLA